MRSLANPVRYSCVSQEHGSGSGNMSRARDEEEERAEKTGAQFLDNADSYINPLDHLDSFHFFIRR